MRSSVNGFNLIEVMIALVISVSLSSVAIGLLIRSVQFSRLQQGLSDLNETAQFIDQFIRNEFYMAGFSGDDGKTLNPINWDFSKDGTKYDQVAIQRFIGEDDYTCLGNALEKEKTYISVFKAGLDSANQRVLFCQVLDNLGNEVFPNQSIANGVNRFQVLYGMEIPANQPKNSPTYAFLPASQALKIDGAKVTSVRLGLLLSNSDQAVFPKHTQVWQVLDKTYDSSKSQDADLNDGHFHKVIEWTIPLKNVHHLISIS